jgi:hypothetical protein
MCQGLDRIKDANVEISTYENSHRISDLRLDHIQYHVERSMIVSSPSLPAALNA